MKKSHIAIAAVVAGVAGYWYWSSRKKPSTAATTPAPAPATTTKTAIQTLAEKFTSAFAPLRTAKASAEPVARTAADGGLDISSGTDSL